MYSARYYVGFIGCGLLYFSIVEGIWGAGLGKWLKAEMARRMTTERPELARIRTENASANAPMLAINRAMGFGLHHTNTIWQIPSDQLVR